MIGLAVCAEPIVRIVLTEKWLPAVFFLRIFCITYAFYPIHTANLNAIKSMGRSDLFLVLEIIKKLVGICAVVITMFISIEALAYSLLFTTLTSMIINSFPNKKLLNYGYFDQLKDILPQILVSVLMGAIVFCISFIPIYYWIQLIIQVPFGVVLYLLLSKVFKIDSYQYVKTIAYGYFKKNKTNKTIDENSDSKESEEAKE